MAASVLDTGDVYLVPAFTGLGAPYWDPNARGAMVGLTRGTTRAHIARAALESIAFQSAELLEAMQKDSGQSLMELRVDGGAAANDLLMQFQADLLGVPVVRPKVLETTALGAAYLAGLTVDLWKSRDELATHWKVDKRFEPGMDRKDRRPKNGALARSGRALAKLGPRLRGADVFRRLAARRVQQPVRRWPALRLQLAFLGIGLAFRCLLGRGADRHGIARRKAFLARRGRRHRRSTASAGASYR